MRPFVQRMIDGARRVIAKALLPPLTPLPSTRTGTGGWYPIVREPYTGAWQKNDPVVLETAIANPTLFACVTLIASDIGKLHLALVQEDPAGIWTETTNPAFSPVLRKPNRYQIPSTFAQQWILSKLLHGNTYALKQRDQRGIVTAIYVLDPTKVTPLISPDGSVYYQLHTDVLAEVPTELTAVPASEVMHDLYCPLFHPLCGVTPIFACGAPAVMALTMQGNSQKFFATGSQPGGVLTAPGSISDATAKRLKDYWDQNYTGDNVGKVAVLGDGLKYEGMSINAVDSELIKQLEWTDAKICSAYHMPPYLVGVGPWPPYGNFEPMVQAYYSQCLQALLTSFEQTLDDGLGLTAKINGTQYGTQFDIDDLIWLDSDARSKAAQQAAGTLSPNEARAKYYAVGPAKGGDSPMVQQQYYSLDALAVRDAADPFAKPRPAPVAVTPETALPARQVALRARELLAEALGVAA